jgi:hypothetical protein
VSDRDDEHRPNPGDFTVCVYCDRLMVFKDDLTLREPTNAEAIEADESGDVAEIRQITKAYRHFKERMNGRD